MSAEAEPQTLLGVLLLMGRKRKVGKVEGWKEGKEKGREIKGVGVKAPPIHISGYTTDKLAASQDEKHNYDLVMPVLFFSDEQNIKLTMHHNCTQTL